MHLTATFLLHGEQIIPMLIAVFLVVLLVLDTLAYWLVRLARHRLGKRSLLIAPLPFVIVAIGGWIWIRSQAPLRPTQGVIRVPR
ncbi:MAG: hypothetical protein DMG97_16565 [Acidobacteria bacterium]|nr:MAG: hypothetical protein DMG97_16565 [Acidobacteriota bacterium]PYV80100.1 MAG: hypothetical protein DMG96_01815 [Acidobacteriota bacterium]